MFCSCCLFDREDDIFEPHFPPWTALKNWNSHFPPESPHFSPCDNHIRKSFNSGRNVGMPELMGERLRTTIHINNKTNQEKWFLSMKMTFLSPPSPIPGYLLSPRPNNIICSCSQRQESVSYSELCRPWRRDGGVVVVSSLFSSFTPIPHLIP